jgi:uncharacterized protein YjgD (DUF1641 family)
VRSLAGLAGAVPEALAVPVAPLGAFGALRALFQPDVQRAFGFALALTRRVAARLPTHNGSEV